MADNQATTPQVILGTISGNTDTDTVQFIKKGFDNLNVIISAPRFKEQFLAFPFEQTKGNDNQQLWEIFLKNSPIAVNVDIRDMGWKADHIYRTIGAEIERYPDTIFMNSYFVKTGYLVGDNAIHEVWHKLGFSHNHASDSTSVPYGCNLLYEAIAKELGIDPNA